MTHGLSHRVNTVCRARSALGKGAQCVAQAGPECAALSTPSALTWSAFHLQALASHGPCILPGCGPGLGLGRNEESQTPP